MVEPEFEKIKTGWAAHGQGWAVHGVTKEEALQLFREAQKRHQDIAKRPMFFEAAR